MVLNQKQKNNMDRTKKLIRSCGDDLIITKDGNIYYKGKKRKNNLTNHGYHRVCVDSKLYYVHRLVSTKYLSNPKNKTDVNHIDGNKSNNHISNLEWSTRKDNVLHSFEIGLNNSNHTRKLTPNQVREIRSKYIPRVYTQKMLGDEYGVDKTAIRYLLQGKTYKNII